MTVIDNPIINGPYDVPTRRWRFDDRGITDVLLDGRRPSESRVPVPRPRKGRVQLELDPRATSERVQRHDQVDQIRQVVERWRSRGYPHTTATTNDPWGWCSILSRRATTSAGSHPGQEPRLL